MTPSLKQLMTTAALAAMLAGSPALAGGVRPVACSVSIDYYLNGVLRAPYQKDFVVRPGVAFEDDFSTATRFNFFEATTRQEGNDTVVSISLFRDVGVFDGIDLRTEVVLRNGNDRAEARGNNALITSRPTNLDHQTFYTVSCERLKD